MLEDRLYQTVAVDNLRSLARQGYNRIILQSQTGSGKTIVAGRMIRCAYEKGKCATFIGHTREIVNQTSAKLWELGVNHAVIMRGEDYDGCPANVTVCSKDTLLSRVYRRRQFGLPNADFVVVDECHLSMSAGWQRLLNDFPERAFRVGLSATPCLANGKMLGEYWQKIVQVVQPSQLINDGYLVPTRVFAPSRPDLKGVPIVGFDYEQGALEKKMNEPQLVGNVIENWLRLADNRQTVVFASGIGHSMHLTEMFRQAGVRAEHLDGTTEQHERDAILARLASGETRVVCNYGVLVAGWDCPQVSCICWVCPTKSFVKWRQGTGRAQRPYPVACQSCNARWSAGWKQCGGCGWKPMVVKTDTLLIDHAGCVYMHGFPDDDLDWTLEAGQNMHREVTKKLHDGSMKTPITCPKCFAIFHGTNECPNCHNVLTRKAKAKEIKNGILVPVGGAAPAEPTFDEYQRCWHRCLASTAWKGRTLSAAAGMFSSLAKKAPWDVAGLGPMPERDEWKMLTAERFPGYCRRRGA